MQGQATDVWCTMTDYRITEDQIDTIRNMFSMPDHAMEEEDYQAQKDILAAIMTVPLPDACTDDTCIYKRFSKNMENAERHDVKVREEENKQLLDRLDKEIATRENEMNRKAGLNDNIVTVSGYYASAGALNWVRVVLIAGSRPTIHMEDQ